jgi:hypothetical protein
VRSAKILSLFLISLLFAAGALVTGCAGTQIGDPSDYKLVDLNRVYPYPTPEELARQKTEVVLATHYTTELPSGVVGQALTAVQQELLHVLDKAGARVIDRSLDNLSKVRRDLTKKYKSRGAGVQADWTLISRMSRFEHQAHYEPASSLFKSEEELASEPGVCTHKGRVTVDIKALVIPKDDVARATFALNNTGEFTQQDFEESCPITDERKEQLLDEILKEALPCLSIPIKNQFSPRGYIEEHRVSTSGDTHIFKTSLGRENGATPGLELSIFRVQYMTTKDGSQGREERQIGHATVTDEIGEDHSWVMIDINSLEQSVLAGDMIRAVYSDTLAAGFGLGQCSDMLKIEIDHR